MESSGSNAWVRLGGALVSAVFAALTLTGDASAATPEGVPAAAPPQIAPSAAIQMQALKSVKTAATPLQRKIDSRLYLGLLHRRSDVRLASLTDFRFVKPESDGRVAVDDLDPAVPELLHEVGVVALRVLHPQHVVEEQRVAVARREAFVAEPGILLLDEPFGSLDAQTKLVLQQELLRIWHEYKRVVVHVTHDIDEAILLSDRIIVMSGRPGTIRAELDVTLPRPRGAAGSQPADFDSATGRRAASAPLDVEEIAALKQRIWQLLEEEVRASLAVPL